MLNTTKQINMPFVGPGVFRDVSIYSKCLCHLGIPSDNIHITYQASGVIVIFTWINIQDTI